MIIVCSKASWFSVTFSTILNFDMQRLSNQSSEPFFASKRRFSGMVDILVPATWSIEYFNFFQAS
jgi:hypothetical protein